MPNPAFAEDYLGQGKDLLASLDGDANGTDPPPPARLGERREFGQPLGKQPLHAGNRRDVDQGKRGAGVPGMQIGIRGVPAVLHQASVAGDPLQFEKRLD